jgi:VanZ family protein
MPRLLLGAYLLFVVYGSFFPFTLTLDPGTVRDNIALAIRSPYDAAGHRVFSLADLASNVILGLPFGFLLVVSGLAGTGLPGRIVLAGALDLMLAATIEAGQLLAPGRVASVVDVGGQVAGSLAGALLGHLVLSVGLGSLGIARVSLLRRRPLLAALAALLGVLAADALYPYAVTLDPSTVWHAIKTSGWDPRAVFDRETWDGLLMDRLVPYATVAGLARAAFAPPTATRLAVIWVGTVAMVAALEAGKLVVEGRALQTGHVLLAGVGALLALAVAPRVVPLAWAHRRIVLPAVAAAMMVYHELRPFDFTAAHDVIAANNARIEWAPFASYIMADPQSALADAGKKVALGALFGALVDAAGHRAPVLWATGLAASLEAAQLFMRSHQPALTDVLLLGGGAWLGAVLLDRYRIMLDLPAMHRQP